jgi:hemoglobin
METFCREFDNFLSNEVYMFDKVKKLLKKENEESNESKDFYKLMGKKAGLTELVERFYFYMESLPEAKECRDLHINDLGPVKEKLVLFLMGWFGGPADYQKKYGHPMMRKRHMPFVIGPKERDQWLLCMDYALRDRELTNEEHTYIYTSFVHFAERMRNRD